MSPPAMAGHDGTDSGGEGIASSETDNQIESAFKNSYVYQTILLSDSISVLSQNDVMTLTGKVGRQKFRWLDSYQGGNGIANISGNAANLAEKDLVTRLAAEIKGVHGVNNEMTIEVTSILN